MRPRDFQYRGVILMASALFSASPPVKIRGPSFANSCRVLRNFRRAIPDVDFHLTGGPAIMSDQAAVAEQQRRYREFLDLLPLTLSLAGLPQSDVGRYFTEEQMEGRTFVLRHAYKAARSIVREAISR